MPESKTRQDFMRNEEEARRALARMAHHTQEVGGVIEQTRALIKETRKIILASK